MTKLIITLPDGSLVPSLPSELIEHRITIGSGVDNTLVVPHHSVAEIHAELILDSAGYLVADLVGNGATKINGHPIEPGLHYQLETGTTIQLGEVEAVYIAADSVAALSLESHELSDEGLSNEPAPDPHVHGGQAFSQNHSAPSAVVAAAPLAAAGEFPIGGYPLPKHPAGVFVPKKAARSLWVIASVAITCVAVAAAVAIGYLSSTVSIAH